MIIPSSSDYISIRSSIFRSTNSKLKTHPHHHQHLFNFKLQPLSSQSTGRKSKRTKKHKQQSPAFIRNPFTFLKSRSKTSTPHEENSNQESESPPPTSQSRLQSLDSLDDNELLDYVDTVSELLARHGEDIDPDSLSICDEDEVPQVQENQSGTQNEISLAPWPLLNPIESASVGKMKNKRSDTIRISTFNSNDLSLEKLQHQLQFCKDEKIDIQCFSEINQNMTNHRLRKKFHETICRSDRSAKRIWANTDLPMESLYKPGGSGIIAFQSVAGRIKESGYDRLGRWSYQLFDSGSDFQSVIFSIYRCSATSKDSIKTAYQQ